jgi:peptide/nickel transport system substrate-binding protein
VAPAAPASSAPVEAPAPRAKKAITVAVGLPLTLFAPIGQSSSNSGMLPYIEIHANGLVTADANGRPTPQIARELPSLDKGTMQLLPDGRLTTTWSLRDDVTWHDGTPFTADDIVLGFKIHADPQLAVLDRTATPYIESAQALDPHTALITWKRPFYLADSLGLKILWPQPAHLLAEEYQAGDKDRFQNLPYWTTQYVHAGPFRLAHFEPGAEAVFEAYDRYFMGRPKLDSITIKPILDRNPLYASILAGDVDLTTGLLDGEQAYALKDQWDANDGGLVSNVTADTWHIALQFSPEYMASRDFLDPRVRRGLYFALDRAGLTQLAYGGRPTPDMEGKSLLPAKNPLASYVREMYASLSGDPQRATQTFAEAGWSLGSDGLLANSERRHLTIEVRSSKENLATAVASMWKQAGVEATSFTPPSALAQDREYQQSYPGAEHTGTGDGDRVLNRFYGPVMTTRQNGFAGSNRGHYDNAQMNELIDRYRGSLRESERGETMRQIAQLVGEELPIMLAFYNPVFGTVRKGVRALDDFGGGYPAGGYYGSYSRTSYLWDRP